jgi:hypothetical protein
VKRSWIIGALAAFAIVAASVAGTLWFTRGSSGNESIEPTSMKAWQDSLAKSGVEPADPERLWELTKTQTCTMDDYGLYVTLGRAPSDLSLSQERLGIRHACPDRLDDWDTAVNDLGTLTDRTGFLCTTPLEELSLDEENGVSDREEAMIVCDEYQGPEWDDYYDRYFAP